MKHKEKLAIAWSEYQMSNANPLMKEGTRIDFIQGYNAAIAELRSKDATEIDRGYDSSGMSNHHWADFLDREEDTRNEERG